MARPDLLRAVAGLSSCVTRWTMQCDRDLQRLICYINTTKSMKLTGWVGDSINDIQLYTYADADFAGDIRTMRSTTGVYVELRAENTAFP